jgi:hypothetical protein
VLVLITGNAPSRYFRDLEAVNKAFVSAVSQAFFVSSFDFFMWFFSHPVCVIEFRS